MSPAETKLCWAAGVAEALGVLRPAMHDPATRLRAAEQVLAVEITRMRHGRAVAGTDRAADPVGLPPTSNRGSGSTTSRTSYRPAARISQTRMAGRPSTVSTPSRPYSGPSPSQPARSGVGVTRRKAVGVTVRSTS